MELTFDGTVRRPGGPAPGYEEEKEYEGHVRRADSSVFSLQCEEGRHRSCPQGPDAPGLGRPADAPLFDGCYCECPCGHDEDTADEDEYDHSRAKEDARNERYENPECGTPQAHENGYCPCDGEDAQDEQAYYLACGDTLLAPQYAAGGSTVLICPRHGLTSPVAEAEWLEQHPPGGPSPENPEGVPVNEGVPRGAQCPCGFQSRKPTAAERVNEIAEHVKAHSLRKPPVYHRAGRIAGDLMACCGQDADALPATDMITSDDAGVTCRSWTGTLAGLATAYDAEAARAQDPGAPQSHAAHGECPGGLMRDCLAAGTPGWTPQLPPVPAADDPDARLTLTRRAARRILDQLWDGVMQGAFSSRLYDELIVAGWPQGHPYAGGEAGLCKHCRKPVQRCKHALPCPGGFEHEIDLLHHCHGGNADTVAAPAE